MDVIQVTVNNIERKIEYKTSNPLFQEKLNEVLEVFDIQGNKVRTLIDRQITENNCTIIWNGDNDSGILLGNGIYFYRLRTPKNSVSGKLIIGR